MPKMPGQYDLSRGEDTHFKIQRSLWQVISQRSYGNPGSVRCRKEGGQAERPWTWVQRSRHRRDSRGLWDVRSPVTPGSLQTRPGPPPRLARGTSGTEECPSRAQVPLRVTPHGSPGRSQASWTGGPVRVSSSQWSFQIILISFLSPFVLSLYDLNQF